MADTIGTAYVQIEPSFDGVVSEVDKHFGGAGASGGKSFTNGFGTAMKGFGVATVAAGAAIGAMGAKFVSASAEVASYGDHIDKMSQKMGISAEAYQEWDAVMQHSGTTIDALKPAMKTLATQAEKGGAAFEKLGISEQEVASLSTEDLFAKVITGLQGMEEGTERTYLTSQLLGRGATELGALLNTSAEETQAMRDRVHELGGVMSDEAVKAAAAYQDQLQDMQTAFQGLSRNLMAEFLPSITGVMSGLTEIFNGNSEKGIGQITESIKTLADGILAAIPSLAETGLKIVEAIATSIISNLPKLLETGFQILNELVGFILDNLDLLIKTGLELIIQLALGIAEALPELIPAVIEAILTIVNTLLDNIDLLIDAAIALIMGLAEGLINATPILIEKAPEIVIKLAAAIIRNAPKILQAAVELILMLVKGIVEAFGKIVEVGKQLVDKVKEGFSQKLQDAKNWGKDMIQNFIDGILAKWNDLKASVSKVADTVKSYLGFSEPEVGPLSNFHTFAPDMMKLFADGITDNIGLVSNAMNLAASDIMGSTVDLNAMQTVSGSVDVQSGSDSIIERIESLLAEYLPNINNNNIYLDTGALVGATAGAYNVALGQIATRGSRR